MDGSGFGPSTDSEITEPLPGAHFLSLDTRSIGKSFSKLEDCMFCTKRTNEPERVRGREREAQMRP